MDHNHDDAMQQDHCDFNQTIEINNQPRQQPLLSSNEISRAPFFSIPNPNLQCQSCLAPAKQTSEEDGEDWFDGRILLHNINAFEARNNPPSNFYPNPDVVAPNPPTELGKILDHFDRCVDLTQVIPESLTMQERGVFMEKLMIPSENLAEKDVEKYYTRANALLVKKLDVLDEFLEATRTKLTIGDSGFDHFAVRAEIGSYSYFDNSPKPKDSPDTTKDKNSPDTTKEIAAAKILRIGWFTQSSLASPPESTQNRPDRGEMPRPPSITYNGAEVQPYAVLSPTNKVDYWCRGQLRQGLICPTSAVDHGHHPSFHECDVGPFATDHFNPIFSVFFYNMARWFEHKADIVSYSIIVLPADFAHGGALEEREVVQLVAYEELYLATTVMERSRAPITTFFDSFMRRHGKINCVEDSWHIASDQLLLIRRDMVPTKTITGEIKMKEVITERVCYLYQFWFSPTFKVTGLETSHQDKKNQIFEDAETEEQEFEMLLEMGLNEREALMFMDLDNSQGKLGTRKKSKEDDPGGLYYY